MRTITGLDELKAAEGEDARHLRLARGHPEGRRHVRRRDRRPPVDPRRRRARQGDAVRRHDRPRLLTLSLGPAPQQPGLRARRASRSRSTTASTRSASRRRVPVGSQVRDDGPKVKRRSTDIPGGAQMTSSRSDVRARGRREAGLRRRDASCASTRVSATRDGAGPAAPRERRRGRCRATAARPAVGAAAARAHGADVDRAPAPRARPGPARSAPRARRSRCRAARRAAAGRRQRERARRRRRAAGRDRRAGGVFLRR